ncbi:RCC1 domain-containing protein RUG3, mitochondrial-like isoform X5 [Pistacia vera]|uniref:RCC1 domain-containing protein RUG3, mitochondrial-like isoform X5 n=1 Tax=Pistacia vera TaxID=55513 RepID=UPI0012636921|nr:RCC1 domain-containing protein RUG3, mitochondrial-like isoform X5 [Pistacia vera]
MLLRQRLTTLTRQCRHLSTSSSSTKIPLLYTHTNENQNDAVTLQLLSWGRGASGQLGGGIEEVRLYPAPVANLSLSLPFTISQTSGRLVQKDSEVGSGSSLNISCGLFHSGLVVDGKLWVWGKGDGGRLGFGHENSVFVPSLNPYLGDDPVQCVALGGVHSVALTSLGKIFTWALSLKVCRGYGGFGALGHSVYHRELFPRLVEGSWNGKIRHIATSGTHTAAITESGELYTWGRDEGDGRLGLGPGPGPNEGGGLSIPSKVKALPVSVAAVSCGGFFTTVLTEEGQLWNWGDEGKVLSWGYGGHGQLGHSSTENLKVPVVIEALADKRVVYIACGGSSSAAITDKGKLYMWGNAKDSQLGVPGLPEVQLCPVEVKFLTEDDGLGPHKVLSVAVGASHAMCLVSRSCC